MAFVKAYMSHSPDCPAHGHAVSTDAALRVVAWETTRRCPLACRHCRGSARDRDYAGELTTAEGLALIENLASFARPILILTGGEPMTRPDIYELAAHATALGLRVVMAPCGPLITAASVEQMKASGIRRISISLDGATGATHDAFRGVPGAFASALRGLELARAGGLAFQINTTVTAGNVAELPAIRDLAERLGATVWDLFFLVPTGRGAALKALALDPAGMEQALRWMLAEGRKGEMRVKSTCAPQVARIQRQMDPGIEKGMGGCIGGRGFAFVSHIGQLQPCGFLDVACGNLRTVGMDFSALYETSPVFRALRCTETYSGKCGYCTFRRSCGGCRARAYAAEGDYLGEDPACLYEPRP